MALAVAERVYQSTDCVNAIFCGKQPAPTFQTVDEAKAELAEGVATWEWASTADSLAEADVVVATCGDVPTLEALAATDMLRELGIKVWFVNVVDLLKIQNVCENDQALSDERWAELFGCGEKPVFFAFHAYAGTIRRLIWNRPGHDAFRVHGYEEKGSTTTPFDMLRLNNMDRWHWPPTCCAWSTPISLPSRLISGRHSAPRPSSSRAMRATITRPSPTGSGPTPQPQQQPTARSPQRR